MCAVGFHEWWNAGSLRQNLVNCSGCAEISSVFEVPESLRGTVTLRRGPQLVLLKVRSQHRLCVLQLHELKLFRQQLHKAPHRIKVVWSEMPHGFYLKMPIIKIIVMSMTSDV